MQAFKTGNHISITIPEGKTMLVDGVEIPAPNWTTCIHEDDTAALGEYLTPQQIQTVRLYGTLEPVDAEPTIPSVPTFEETKAYYEAQIDKHIHSVVRAQPYLYTSIDSSFKYTVLPEAGDDYTPSESDVARHHNAVALHRWVHSLWAVVDGMYLEASITGVIPPLDDVLSSLPIFNQGE